MNDWAWRAMESREEMWAPQKIEQEKKDSQELTNFYYIISLIY